MILKNSEKKENNHLQFTVESDEKEFDNAVNKAYLKNKKQINIPGFRKGKAPLSVIEGMYGPEVFYQDALDELCGEAFEKGIVEGEFKFIGRPAIAAADVTEQRTATFTFDVELYPEVELGQYKGLEIVKPVSSVSDEEIEAEISAEQKKNARMVTIEDRGAQMGDTVNIDFDGFLDKEKTDRFDGGKAEGYDLELGSNSFVPGFEEQIVGMNIGEEKDINITFPQEYVENLAGKEVVFNIKLNSITFPELPVLDDEFAKDVSEFDTLDEYKADIKKNLLAKKEEQGKAVIRAEAVNKACDNMKCDVPDTLINAKLEEIIRNFAANYGVSDPSMDLKTLASMLGIDEQTMNTTLRPTAEAQAKSDILINAVCEAENFEVTEDDVKAYAEKMAQSFGVKAEDVLAYYGEDMIKSEFKKDKAIDLLVETAVLTDEKPAKAKKASAKKKAAEPKEEEAEKSEEKPKKKAAPKKTAKKEEE